MINYCPGCGTKIDNNNHKFCQVCGFDLTQFNQTSYTTTTNKNPHQTAIIIGYIFGFLGGFIGIVIGIYLMTRNNEDAKKHGMIIAALAFLVMIITRYLF